MKTLVLASLLLTQTGPNWRNGDPKAVPSPIPADICVEAHITEKGQQYTEDKISIYSAPLDSQAIQILSEMRKRGLAVLKRCQSTDS